MTPTQIDFYFPYALFFYGFLVALVLETPVLSRIGKERMEGVFAQLSQRRGLAWISFFLGGLWMLQNLWLT